MNLNHKKILQPFIGILLWGVTHAQSEEKYTVLKYAEISKLNIQLPYIKYYGKDQLLLVFGSNHTTQWSNPQILLIKQLIADFSPSIILYEGDGISTENTGKETVETYSEMGFAKYLADSLKIKSLNIEPNTHDKFKYLLANYEIEDILLATLGLQITMFQMDNKDFNSLYPNMVGDLVKEGLPLAKEQQSIQYFYSLYKVKFGKEFSYENFDSRQIQPKYNTTLYNKINQTANEFRDKHIIHLVKKTLQNGDKVFLLVGGWHAIVCEPAFNEIVR
ncbi:MAG: hypothetical protein JNM78_03125 [Cyclobacteriaceae bacterium]|nr:hypothetical protein [Cyclobacteriaceae bacterium]